MRNLTATLCLTLAVLLFSATEGFALPSCPTDTRVFWTDCFGTFTYPDGAKYVGEWRDDKAHGQGTATFADGNKYVGEFRDGKPHGQGTYTFADGGKYVGEFRDDKRHGQGTYTFASGNKYVGEWRDGKKNGQGTLTFADGAKHVGEWRDDKRHGQGTYTYADGRIAKEGIWKDDEFQYAKMASSSADAEAVATVRKTMKDVYLQYHFADLCHGSEIISGSEIARMQTQIKKISKFFFADLDISEEKWELLKDNAWDDGFEQLNADPTLQMHKVAGLGRPMTALKRIEMREGCVTSIDAINVIEGFVDMGIEKSGKGKKKKRTF